MATFNTTVVKNAVVMTLQFDFLVVFNVLNHGTQSLKSLKRIRYWRLDSNPTVPRTVVAYA